jgi:flagellin
MVNDNSDTIGVTATYDSGTNALVLTTKEVGSAANLTVNAGIDDILTAAVTTDVYGSDATITETAIGTSYIARGNTITVTGGNYKGLELQLNSEVMSTTGTNNLNTFSIDSNGTLGLQIGANEAQKMNISIGDMGAAALGVSSINVTTQSSAEASITTIDSAITAVSSERSKMGAYQNRLEHTINNLGTSSENLTAAESRVRDVDMAKEMMEFTKNNILNQAATAMLAQANQAPQGVLQLLR